MLIPVVDENDEIIRYKDGNNRNPTDIIRISCLWIINSKSEALITQRSLKKYYSPGKWTVSVSGTLEGDESYWDNISRETKEELGITIDKADILWSQKKYINTLRKYYCTFYFVKKDLLISSFVIQKEEVEQVKWIKIEDLVEWYKDKADDFSIAFPAGLDCLLEFIKAN